MKQHDKPLNFEQACNYLDEKKDTLAKDTKKDTAGFDAVVDASPENRRRFLLYALSLVDSLSPAVKKLIPTELLLGGGESNRELIRSMKHYMTLRIHGCSLPYIANCLGRHVQVLLKVEQATMVAIKEAIEYRKAHGIPIVGR